MLRERIKNNKKDNDSTLMSREEYDSFMSRMKRKGYNNDAVKEANGSIINPNKQISAGIKFLEENNIRI